MATSVWQRQEDVIKEDASLSMPIIMEMLIDGSRCTDASAILSGILQGLHMLCSFIEAASCSPGGQ